MSQADETFIKNCTHILKNGISDKNQNIRPRWKDGTPAYTLSIFGMVNEYDLSVEFPALTLRRLSFKNCIDEILWIYQKKSNKVNELKSKIWDSWANESGTIGKAYGYQLGIKHKYPEGEFDQVDRLLFDLKNNPSSRRMLTNMYNHQDLHEMELYPCAYGLTFSVAEGKLNAILNQRSQDFLTANNWNVCQYAVLVHMLASVSGLKAGKLLHVIADAHIYDRHIPIVESLIKNEPRSAPIFQINTDVKNFYDFTIDDFKLEKYKPHKSKHLEIEVAV
ncbi:MAG: thymidylate synthase [Defluviitaleaceae bacterium]|nr:thymidylate synthase [Defluviitaleaceae bacterium]